MFEHRAPIHRIQSYLLASARQRYQAVSVPPFVLFFHPEDDLIYFNYAVPDRPVEVAVDIRAPLDALRAEFHARQRRPRFEFIEEDAPHLAPLLRANGFVEESRTRLMICDSAGLQLAPGVPGLSVAILTADSPLEEIRSFQTVQRRGFEPENLAEVTGQQASSFRERLGDGRAFLARLEERPVGAGVYTAPIDHLSELAGVATLEEFRHRGIASALASRAAETAFANGVDTLFLSAADERAGRVYERVGFRAFATSLAYVTAGS